MEKLPGLTGSSTVDGEDPPHTRPSGPRFPVLFGRELKHTL